MLSLHAISKDMKLFGADYILDDNEKLLKLMPYLLPKIEGEWYIALIEPKLDIVRMYLNTNVLPDYIQLEVYLDKSSLGQILLEYPKMEIQSMSPWEVYMHLLEGFPVPMEQRAMKELYYRVGPKREDLEGALGKLTTLEFVTLKDINKFFLPNNRVYAKQVVLAFLQKNYKQGWKLYGMLEQELGIDIAFFAMRKYIRKLLKEKYAYLNNKPTKEKAVSIVDTFTILHAYYVFEQATSPKQLITLLTCIERRIALC